MTDRLFANTERGMTDAGELPELPEPVALMRRDMTLHFHTTAHREEHRAHDHDLVTVDQMRSYARLAVQQERADFERKLALQKASYEREIAIEVEAERERCAKLAETTPCPGRDIRSQIAAAIRSSKDDSQEEERKT